MGSVPEESVAAAPEVVFRSRLPDIEIPNEQTLQSYCFAKMAEVGSRPCIIDGQTGASYTYAEVESLSRKAAAGLRRMGVGKGDVVMNLLRNCPEFAFSFLGAARLGAATTTANPFYTPHEIHRQADAAGAMLIVTEACAVDKVLEYAAGKGLPVVTVDGRRDGCVEFSELIAGEELPEAEEAGIHPDDVVALPYSSGTTGLPKGVMLTHRSLITSVAQQVDGENPNLYFNKDDVLLCLLPLFHIYSLNSVLLAGLRAGSAMVIMRKFDIGALVELVRAHGITVAPFVPPIVVEIAKSPQVTADDLASIRMVMSGAAPMGKELQDAFMAKIPNAVLGQGYGMTEAGPVLAMCLAFAKEPFKVKSGSCGTVVRNAGLKIVDPETGASLGRNQPGEICIRGEQIMKATLQNTNALVRMSLPCSDQSIRPTKMKTATLPRGVEVLRCWCGDLCKVKEVTDFSDWLGMKFFMCANYEEDPPVSISPYIRPPSPPPLCMYYRWIDTKKPDWAVTEIRERGRRAWASLDLEERRAKAAAEEKAEQEREWQEYCVKQRAFLDEMKKKNREEGLRLAEVYRQREEAREAERQMKKERARAAKAAEEAGDGKGKYPRWTQ